MFRRSSTVFSLILFAVSFAFLLGACAKKVVKEEEKVTPTAIKAEETKPVAPKPVEETKPAETKVPAVKPIEVKPGPVTETKEAPKEVVKEAPKPVQAAKAVDEQAEKIRKAEEQAFATVDIHFDFDKYDLKPRAREILADKAYFLKKNTSVKVLIEGHCDERGTNEYNLALGERRANAAKEYLISLGVQEGRMATISYGEERPLDPGHNEEAWAKNRRAHFVITAK